MTTRAGLLDRAFYAIMTSMAQTGRAPNHVELAGELSIDPEVARAAFNDIMASGYPGWLDEHDAIVTICPLSNRPNQYKISVGGEHKWFGQ